MTKSQLVIDGLSDLRRHLRRTGKEGVKAAQDEVATAAINIQRDAKNAVSVDLGRLRSSISWRFTTPSRLTAETGSNVEYAPFVEFGTGPAGENSQHSAFAEQAMTELGYVHGPKGGFPPLEEMERWCRAHGIPEEAAFQISLQIRKNGTPASPYLIPAMESERREFPRRLQRSLGAVVKRAGR